MRTAVRGQWHGRPGVDALLLRRIFRTQASKGMDKADARRDRDRWLEACAALCGVTGAALAVLSSTQGNDCFPREPDLDRYH